MTDETDEDADADIGAIPSEIVYDAIGGEIGEN
jgi:hypothetical protein